MGKQLCKHKDREITWMENTPEYIEKPIDLPQVTGKLCKCKSNYHTTGGDYVSFT
jgi:hypothetical protein